MQNSICPHSSESPPSCADVWAVWVWLCALRRGGIFPHGSHLLFGYCMRCLGKTKRRKPAALCAGLRRVYRLCIMRPGLCAAFPGARSSSFGGLGEQAQAVHIQRALQTGGVAAAHQDSAVKVPLILPLLEVAAEAAGLFLAGKDDLGRRRRRCYARCLSGRRRFPRTRSRRLRQWFRVGLVR